jgi:hypothetical protein
MTIQVQESKVRLNLTKSAKRYLINQTKLKDESRILKSSRENGDETCKTALINLIPDFSKKTYRSGRSSVSLSIVVKIK